MRHGRSIPQKEYKNEVSKNKMTLLFTMAESATKHESYSPKPQVSTLNILVFSEAEIVSFLFAYLMSSLLERVIELEGILKYT